MLREIRYGIEVDVNSVSIAPFPAIPYGTSFHYKFGKVDVFYSANSVKVSIPGGEGPVARAYSITSLLPDSQYLVAQECAKKIHPLFSNSKVFSNRGNLPQRSSTGSSDSLTLTTDSSGLLTFTLPVNNQCTVTVSHLAVE